MDSVLFWKFVGVSLYLLVLLAIGVVASRRMGDLKDYFAGGKNLGFWAVAFSSRATGESAWLLLGLTGMGAAFGVHAFWVVVGEVLGVCGAWLFMAGRFKHLTDGYDSITIPDYLESRFRDTTQQLRVVSAICLTIFVTIYVSAQIDATGTAFETFLRPSEVLGIQSSVAEIGNVWFRDNFDYVTGALIGFAVVMAYSTSGGFVAVVWSDIFQGTLMFFGLVILPIAGAMSIGGFGVMAERLTAIDPELMTIAGKGGWSLSKVMGTLGLALIGLGFLGSPQVFVRFLALKDAKEIPKGTLVAFVWTLLADSGAVLSGMVGRAALSTPEQSPDVLFKGTFDPAGQQIAEPLMGSGGEAILPMLVADIFPPMIIGLYIAIVLSAIMSTVDSLLVVAASAAVRDWYQKVRNPNMGDHELVNLSRQATFGLAIIALTISMSVAVMSETRTIFWFVIFGWSGIAATFCPTMILSLYWAGFTKKGALASMISGFLAVPLFKFIPPMLVASGTPEVGDPSALAGVAALFVELAELPPAFAASFFIGIGVSLMDKDGLKELQGIELELADAAAGRTPKPPPMPPVAGADAAVGGA